jgi:hypothetical protein
MTRSGGGGMSNALFAAYRRHIDQMRGCTTTRCR